MNEIQTRFENLAAYVASANATDRDRRAWASALDNALASEREGLARYSDEWAAVVVSSYGCALDAEEPIVTEDTEPRCPATFGSTGEEDDRCVLAENHEPPRHETATGVEWGPWIHRDIDRTRSVTYTAANGHRMSYYARASDPTRAAFGAGSGAWCAEGCPACAAGEALPDW